LFITKIIDITRKGAIIFTELFTISGVPFEATHILGKYSHESESLAGWIGLATWTVKDLNDDLWDVDWRYAFGTEIFKQHWIDFGWDEEKLLYHRKSKEQKRHKAIIYVCAPDMEIPVNYSVLKECESNEVQKAGLLEKPLWHSIPERYIISRFWQSIHRGLIPLNTVSQQLHELLPKKLPQLQELAHGNFATTRELHQLRPTIINNPEDEVHTVLFLSPHQQRLDEGGLRTKELFKHGNIDNKPLISVITVVFNDFSHIEQTIQSIINQSSDHVEYIIIDGGSTDGTLEIIKQYDEQIDYWISEPDNGIYDAMNKGITALQGDFHNFMNSCDFFIDMKSFEGNYHSTFFKTIYPRFDGNNNICKVKSIKYSIPYCHQGIIYSKPKLLFNLKYKYASDYLYTIEKSLIIKHTSEKAKVYYANNGVTSNNIFARLENTKIVYMRYGIKYYIKSLLVEFIKYNIIKLYCIFRIYYQK